MSEEIESRLEASFALTEYLRREWGEDIFRIAKAAAGSLSFIEDYTGKAWTEDEETYQTLQATMLNLIKNYRDRVAKRPGQPMPPQGDFDGKTIDERGQMFAAVGGIEPPRRSKPLPPTPTSDEDLAKRRQSKANMLALLAEREIGQDVNE